MPFEGRTLEKFPGPERIWWVTFDTVHGTLQPPLHYGQQICFEADAGAEADLRAFLTALKAVIEEETK